MDPHSAGELVKKARFFSNGDTHGVTSLFMIKKTSRLPTTIERAGKERKGTWQ
jgi:hypothetical protein